MLLTVVKNIFVDKFLPFNKYIITRNNDMNYTSEDQDA